MISIQSEDYYYTHVQAFPWGEFSDIPLHCSEMTINERVEQAIKKIQNDPCCIDYFQNVYTWQHYGEEDHRWQMVGYEAFEKIDGKMGLIKLFFTPVNKDAIAHLA